MQAEGIFRINAENSQEEYVREQLNGRVVPEGIDVHCGGTNQGTAMSFNLTWSFLYLHLMMFWIIELNEKMNLLERILKFLN